MHTENPTLDQIVSFFRTLQDDICQGMEQLDGTGRFQEDPWERAAGGGGRSRLMTGGSVFEKGGVNFSHVHGPMPDKIAEKLNLPAQAHFHATGVSIVIHPSSPRVPIIHMNVRYFEISNGTHWFGGGIDLTPIYVVPTDAQFFHQSLQSVCDRHDPAHYAKFKPWCDEYFYIKHRKETRGIGGIFFDHLKASTGSEKAANFAFVKEVGQAFVPAYSEIVNRHREEAYGQRELDFQLLRRSRYVEFNLVYDRGTKFGLDTDGRTESILMSMPPLAGWTYNYQPEPGSPEAETLESLKATDWVPQ